MTDPFIPVTPQKFRADPELAEWVRRVHTMLEDLAREQTAIAAQQAAIVTGFNALLVKLDADAGVGDSDYESTLGL